MSCASSPVVTIKPESVGKSDILSNSIDGAGVGDLHGGAVSAGEALRSMHRPAMGEKQAFLLAHASIDNRY